MRTIGGDITFIIEVEQNGTLTLPPDVLTNAKPHTRYVVETNGVQLILRLEESEVNHEEKAGKRRALSPEQ